MEQYIDLSPGKKGTDRVLQIQFEYTALDGTVIRGRKLDDPDVSMALEIFANLDVMRMPPADLTKPYKLTLSSAPS